MNASKNLWNRFEMKDLFLPNLLMLAKELGRLAEEYANSKPGELLEDQVRENNVRILQSYAKDFADLELPMCRLQAERLAEQMDGDANGIGKGFADLYSRMEDECGLRKFLILSSKQADLIFPSSPAFGTEVSQKLPKTAFEVDEASKCLGVGLDTAAVFHLMRVVEIGIEAVRKSLAIPDPIRAAERNWGVMIKKINEAVSDKKQLMSQPDTQFFIEIQASLDAVRNAWRNATMHVESKYTADEAEHIFIAVKGFMRKVATRMDEEGMPLA